MSVRRFLSLSTLAFTLWASSATAYTVQRGDTLYSIARANGLSIVELKRLNNLNSDLIKVGQVLRLSSAEYLPPPSRVAEPLPVSAPNNAPVPVPPMPLPAGSTPNTNTPPPTTAPETIQPLPERAVPLPADRLTLTPAGIGLEGVNITAPNRIKSGDAFVIRLSGRSASKTTVRFLSEYGEDVRKPGEVLRPFGAAGEYRVVGRAVLGKTTPVVYEVALGRATIRRQIAVTLPKQAMQNLNLPRRISRVLEDPNRDVEDQTLERAYARRTKQLWTKPFAPALAKVRPISSSFGRPRTYVAGGPVTYHYGTDYSAPAGTSIRAVNDGIVVIAGRYPVRGGLVVIDHGTGVTSSYFHQSRIWVKPGTRIRRGQKIGEVGSTGLSAGPHLHLEIRVRGEATNPLAWMNRIWPR